jgi:hypothetical protein
MNSLQTNSLNESDHLHEKRRIQCKMYEQTPAVRKVEGIENRVLRVCTKALIVAQIQCCNRCVFEKRIHEFDDPPGRALDGVRFS